MQKLDVRVLGEFVLVKQVMKKKNSRIITDAAKDENEKFDFYYEILEVGNECKRGIQVGESPIFNQYVKFQSVKIVHKDNEGMTAHVIVYESDIIAIDLAPKVLEDKSLVENIVTPN